MYFLNAITFDYLLQDCTSFLVSFVNYVFYVLSDNILFFIPIALVVTIIAILSVFRVIS